MNGPTGVLSSFRKLESDRMRPSPRPRMRHKSRCKFGFAAKLTTALLCAPTLLGSAGSALQAQQQAAAPTVEGRLVGPDGAAAAGLEVRLIPVPNIYERRLRELGVSDAIPVVDRTRSDADGRFELSTSRVGPHQLEILAAAPQTRPPTVVAPVYVRQILLAEPTLLPPIRLPTMHNLIVGAKDEAGQPVVGALVLVQAAYWSAPEHRWHGAKKLTSPFFGRAAARTNSDGMARFSIPTAASSVAVAAPGFNLSVDDLSQDRAAFQLRRGEGVTFRVLDRDGAPVPRAVIRIGGNEAIPLALTDERGEATVGLMGGRGISYQIEAEDGSFAQTARVKREPPSPDGPRIVEVHLWPGFELRGQVVNATTNQPIELATLWIAGQLDRLAWSGDGGEFTLTARADHRLWVASEDAGLPRPAIWIAAADYATKRVWLGLEHLQAADRRKPLRVELRQKRPSQAPD